MVYKYGLDEGMEIIIHENVFFFIHICIEQSYRDIIIFEIIPRIKKVQFKKGQ